MKLESDSSSTICRDKNYSKGLICP